MYVLEHLAWQDREEWVRVDEEEAAILFKISIVQTSRQRVVLTVSALWLKAFSQAPISLSIPSS